MSTAIVFTKGEIARYYEVRVPHLRQVERRELRGPCPIHNGKDDNFAVQRETGLAFCHSSCNRGWDMISLEMELANADFKTAKAEIFRIIGRPAQNGDGRRNGSGSVQTLFDYTNEAGELLFQVKRTDFPGGKKKISHGHPDSHGRWIPNLNGVRRVLYRLPRLVKAQQIFLVEGEKCVHALEQLGLTATTSPMGAGNWRDEYAETLAGKDLVVLPDNDDPGRKHAFAICRSVIGKAKSVRPAELPDLPGKGDVVDWIAAGGTRDQLMEIVTQTAEWDGTAAEPERRARPENTAGSKPGFKAETPSIFEKMAPYPEPIRQEGFYGIAGEFVRLVEPHTEADRNFLLVSFLVHAGNVLGRDAWTWAGADKHHANLFACGVGTSSTGRKGSAASPTLLFFQGVDPRWAENITSGLSTGEGLISAVRDPIKKLQPKKGSSEMEEVCIDEGIQDKRLLVIQPEFYGALQAMKRQGNTLSTTIRDAWDRPYLKTLIKNNPHRATNPHVSIIGNITREELLRGLLAEELDNGFANRFLWACSQRSKELPEGGRICDVDFAPLQRKFQQIRALVQGPVWRDAEAGDLWGHDDQPGDGMYHHLSRERGGMFGKVCSRAPAQVLRLALVYALLDGSREVRSEHQDAALAVWQYCEDSAAYIFGDATGDPTADAIVGALRTAGTAGMTRTELSHIFQRNTPAAEITRAVKVLHETGRARFVMEPSGGRSTERWFLTKSGGIR